MKREEAEKRARQLNAELGAAGITDRRNRFVMAGSFAPRNAAWLFPRPAREQLAQMPEAARRRARIAVGIALALTALVLTLALTGHGRIAAYALLLAFGLYALAATGRLIRRTRSREPVCPWCGEARTFGDAGEDDVCSNCGFDFRKDDY